eukprot:TRINITY_DN601_c0_g1_i1.p1 TRINITY_DN601_c0_g1~~TRINITY_DN601_c0_g1_i1.p1  ORF type:complete len:918 (+),score=298.93 TRINITY_DN601_c0_g1_i1:109-2862(+)
MEPKLTRKQRKELEAKQAREAELAAELENAKEEKAEEEAQEESSPKPAAKLTRKQRKELEAKQAREEELALQAAEEKEADQEPEKEEEPETQPEPVKLSRKERKELEAKKAREEEMAREESEKEEEKEEPEPEKKLSRKERKELEAKKREEEAAKEEASQASDEEGEEGSDNEEGTATTSATASPKSEASAPKREKREKKPREQKLSRKERKELEKKEAYEAELAEAKREGENGAFVDSPYSVRMPEDSRLIPENSRDIKVEQVSIAVPGKELFINTTVKVTAGHRYGLVGPNGWGKSTILKLLSLRELPMPSNLHVLIVEQEQEVDEDVLEETVVNVVIKSHKLRIALMAEADKLRESGENLERLQEIEDDLNAMGAHQAEAKARKILGGLGFPTEWQDRKVSSFSGGWRKRVPLACAVFMEPDILLLDEPTNHLDLNAVIWLETYLPSVYNTEKKKPKSLVVVSHDVSFLDEVCTDTAFIDRKLLHYHRGGYEMAKSQMERQKKADNKDYKLLSDFIKNLKKQGLTKNAFDEKLEAQARKKGWDLSNLPTKYKEYQVTFPWDNPPELRESYIVKAEDMHFRYGEEHPWIFGGPNNKSGVSFSVWTDSRIALVGPNGCGKTTLIQLLSGQLEASKGYIEINRQVRIGKYSQHFVGQLPLDDSPIDYLVLCGMKEHQARAKLGAFGLEGKCHKQQIKTLSGGQKVRVAFAGISARLPHVLLLDEPTNHLDMESIEALADALNRFKGGVLVITHDARLIETVQANLWVVEDNNVVNFDGGVEEYREHIVKILDLEEERKALEVERKRELKKLKSQEREVEPHELARREAKMSKKKKEEAEAAKAKAEAARKAEEEDLDNLFNKKDKKKDKKDKKDGDGKKDKKEKKDKKDKKEGGEKKEKKEKKEEKKDKKEKKGKSK